MWIFSACSPFRDLIRFSRRCSSLWDYWLPGIFRATVGWNLVSPLLPVELSEIFFRQALAVVTSGVDFIVAMFLEYVKDSGGIFVFMNSCLLNS